MIDGACATQSNFKDESCGHDVFSGGALKRMSLADIMCLAKEL